RWHKLHSKAGKKEKERGEILVSLQFTRHSLTASMFDLSVKDKARSPFGKLKDKVTGKKKYDLESASAIIPSSMAALDVEDDLELGGKKSKLKGFFLKNKLRRSSLTQSSTSLGSDSTISSASLSLAAPVAEVPRSPSRQGSLSTERSVKEPLASPRLSHKRAFSDDASPCSAAEVPQSPQGRREPASRSSLCINGSHVYGEEAAAPRSPAASAPLPVPRRQDEPHWGLGSLERAPQRDEPRFIPSPPSLALQEELKVSTKAVTLSNHLGRARMEESARLEGKPSQGAAPVGFPAEPAKDRAPEDSRKEDKKAKGGFFHHGGKGQGDRGTPVHASAAGDERSKSSGWFGSKEPKESPQKPSLEVSPQVETSSDAPSHCAPRSPAPCPAALAASMPSSNLPPAPGDRQAGCLAPTNPFLNSLQSNPFFEELLADQVLNSPSPTHFLSSFPPGPPPGELPAADTDTEPAVPPLPSEWDDTFDAFATSRLKPERNKENFFASVAAEGMAFIDDPRASPTESPAGPPCQKGSQAGEEESCGTGTNGWMTIATESAAEPSESAGERTAPQGPFGPRPPFLGEGTFEAQSSSRATTTTTCVLPRSSFPPEPAPEAPPGSTVVAAEPGGSQRGKQEPWEESEGPGAEMGLPRSRASSEPSVPAPPSLPAPGAAAAEAGREFAASEGARAAAVDPAAGLETGAGQLGAGDTSVGEHQSEMSEAEVAEQFETCTSNFSLDGLDRSGAEGSWSQPRLSPQGATDSAKWEAASKQELFPEELRISGLNPPSKLDLGQPASWTALEEQEAAGQPQPQPQRSEQRQRPCQLELACQDGEGRAGEQPRPRAPPQEAEQGRTPAGEEPGGRWAENRIDFKKADFWKPDRIERHTQGASALRNPFTLALSPSSPSNPFVEKPPAPVQAVLPEKLEQGDFSFRSPQEEPPGHGLQPTNAPPLHVSQPLAFSTPFPAAATNPEPCGRPRAPAGVPARRAAARPCPCPQPGEASALLVLPRETRPAEKPLGQQTTSPHPVKPLSAVQEGSSERKQQHRASLSSALSDGLERLKTATTSSVQPLAPASQQDKTDPKVKDPGQLDQSAKYYHLTHDELIQLLLQKEGELSKKEEHIHELENYIDQLLVRIMEQSPTLLQIPLG
ncbi:RFIP5 protein, partial [Cardinalis cardinalis]|nr:RFIP5 protein [Cardinalis cardinalis]